MIDPVQSGLLEWAVASVGWAVLAARAVRPASSSAVLANPADAPVSDSPVSAAPVRLRATITIEIDAEDAEDAERQAEAVRGQFEMMKRDHPTAALAVQRRKPRVRRRAPAPTLVVPHYVDD